MIKWEQIARLLIEQTRLNMTFHIKKCHYLNGFLSCIYAAASNKNDCFLASFFLFIFTYKFTTRKIQPCRRHLINGNWIKPTNWMQARTSNSLNSVCRLHLLKFRKWDGEQLLQESSNCKKRWVDRTTDDWYSTIHVLIARIFRMPFV